MECLAVAYCQYCWRTVFRDGCHMPLHDGRWGGEEEDLAPGSSIKPWRSEGLKPGAGLADWLANTVI